MNTADFKKKVQGLISDGKTISALQMLKEKFVGKNNPALNEVIIIMGEFEELNRRTRINAISENELQVRINGINSSILILLEKHFSSKIPDNTEIRKTKKGFLFISVVTALTLSLLLFISYKFCNPDTVNKIIVDRNDIITALVENKLGDSIYQEYRLVYLQGVEIKRYGVLDGTKSLIVQLEEHRDEDLEMHGKIFKHIGLMISNKIMCLLTSSKQEQIDYSNKALFHADKSESLINAIQNLEDEEYRNDLTNWVTENKHLTRVAINKFIASAINFKSGGTVSVSTLKENFNRVSNNDILVNEGYRIYPIVKWLEQERIISLNFE